MSIDVINVSKRFGDFDALREVSLTVDRGALTALLGPSGGGKSTLLRIIAGLDTADSGRVLIDGNDVTGVPAQRRGVGFVFQHYAAFPHMTVWDNVAFGLKVARAGRADTAARVAELLELVHLAGLAQRYPAELSGGQRQRMALARALAVRPRLLLLDEPFGALDANVRAELREWLRRLHEQVSTTTVFVTHDTEEAMELADEIVLINEGCVEQVGAPEELYHRPGNAFVMSFLGATTSLGGRLVRPHDIDVLLDPDDGTHPAMIERVVPLGFHTRIDAVLADGSVVTVQLTTADAQQLEVAPGDIVFLRVTPGATAPVARHGHSGRPRHLVG